jgi:serine/threonine protein kinase/formylglycine-generating enzyme required for sulfatase activity
MNASQIQHPTDQALQAYGLGKLDDDTAESMNKHVESCSVCQRRVAELSSDSFLGRLRDAQGRPDSTGPAMSATAGQSMSDVAPGSPAPPPASTLPPGLADHPDYEITRELGRGGMGVVYLAQNKIMGRTEVLEVVGGHLINRRGVVDRFLAEIRNAARLRHPNIVTAFSVVRVGDSLVLAMEHIDGLDLTKLVLARGPLPVSHACNYVHQAALGLQHAHEHGMVHRDIKPSNLMLARQGNRALIKVLDFGLAKVQSEGAVDGGLTHEGQMLGTPHYIAPEQISDARRADTRADIYSLGCTLYYLLTGSPPFDGTSLYDILQAHHSMDAMPLNLKRPEVPIELAALAAKMMAKEPERRFQEPKDVAQALAPFFKKGSVSPKVSSAEVSQTGETQSTQKGTGTVSGTKRPESKPASTPPPSGKRPAATAQPESIWDNLLELEQVEPAQMPALAPAPVKSKPKRRAPWIWPSVAAGLLALGLLIVWMTGVLVKTANGIIELPDLPKDAEVSVDGEKVKVTWSNGGERAIVTVSPGTHNVRVMKDGVELSGEEVTVQADGKEKLTVRLVPSDPPAPAEEPPASVATSANTKAVNDALEMLIPMKFPEDTPLEDILKYIKDRTKGSIKSGIPIYVDPIGLQEAVKSMTSTTRFNVENRALRVTLRLLLEGIDLAYTVKDGLLIISSAKGMERASKEAPILVSDDELSTRRMLSVLERPIPMHYEEDAPLENVLENIKDATSGEFQHHVDWKGIQEAKKSMTSTVRNLDVEGVPLKRSLRELLKQLTLDYLVEDGLVIITSGESVRREQEGTNAPQKVAGDDKQDRATGQTISPTSKKTESKDGIAAAQPEFVTTHIGQINLKRIPAGKFMMGSPDGEGTAGEHPEHEVRITRPFYLGIFEVTQGQYKAVTGQNPSDNKGSDNVPPDKLPLERVHWLEAVKFCNKLSEREGLEPFYKIERLSASVPDWGGRGYRLPTEAEWEYACRAGTTTLYSFGDDDDALGQHSWYSANSNNVTHAVGQKDPNRFGFHDMLGNVWEWCWDWYGEAYYEQSPTDDPRGPAEGTARVCRGGCWNFPAERARSARRDAGDQYRNFRLGFRMARNVGE